MKRIIYLLSFCSAMSALYSCGEDDDVIASLSEKQMVSYGTYGNYKLKSLSSDGYHVFYYNEKGIIEKISLRQGYGTNYDTGDVDKFFFSAGLDTVWSNWGSKKYAYELKFNKNGYVTQIRTVSSTDHEHNVNATFDYDSQGYMTRWGKSKIEWKNGCPSLISSGEALTRENDSPIVGYTMEFKYDSNTENSFGICCLPYFSLWDDSPSTSMKIKDVLGVLGMLGKAPKLLPDSVIVDSYRANHSTYHNPKSYVYQIDEYKDKQFAVGWKTGSYNQYFNFE